MSRLRCVSPSFNSLRGVYLCLCPTLSPCACLVSAQEVYLHVCVCVYAYVCLCGCAEQGGHAYEVPYGRPQGQVQSHHCCPGQAWATQGAHLTQTWDTSGSTQQAQGMVFIT